MSNVLLSIQHRLTQQVKETGSHDAYICLEPSEYQNCVEGVRTMLEANGEETDGHISQVSIMGPLHLVKILESYNANDRANVLN